MAHQRVPVAWESEKRPGGPARLLVESDDPAMAVSDFTLFSRARLSNMFCPGKGCSEDRCGLLDGRNCGMVDEADVVLTTSPRLGVWRPRSGEVSPRPADRGDPPPPQRRRGDRCRGRTYEVAVASTAPVRARIEALHSVMSAARGRNAAG